VEQECDNFLIQQISFSLIFKEKIFADRSLNRTKDDSRRNREGQTIAETWDHRDAHTARKTSQKVKQSFILSLSKDLNFKFLGSLFSSFFCSLLSCAGSARGSGNDVINVSHGISPNLKKWSVTRKVYIPA
jgi:hypothetical protein